MSKSQVQTAQPCLATHGDGFEESGESACEDLWNANGSCLRAFAAVKEYVIESARLAEIAAQATRLDAPSMGPPSRSRRSSSRNDPV